MWRLPWTNSYSYPRVVTIQINIHLVGKTCSTQHTFSTLDLCMTLNHTYLTWSTYSNLSRVISNVGRILLLPRKSASDSTSQSGWVDRKTHPSFSLNTAIKAVSTRATNPIKMNQIRSTLILSLSTSILLFSILNYILNLICYSSLIPTKDPS
jgi:hypothetical protein